MDIYGCMNAWIYGYMDLWFYVHVGFTGSTSVPIPWIWVVWGRGVWQSYLSSEPGNLLLVSMVVQVGHNIQPHHIQLQRQKSQTDEWRCHGWSGLTSSQWSGMKFGSLCPICKTFFTVIRGTIEIRGRLWLTYHTFTLSPNRSLFTTGCPPSTGWSKVSPSMGWHRGWASWVGRTWRTAPPQVPACQTSRLLMSARHSSPSPEISLNSGRSAIHSSQDFGSTVQDQLPLINLRTWLISSNGYMKSTTSFQNFPNISFSWTSSNHYSPPSNLLTNEPLSGPGVVWKLQLTWTVPFAVIKLHFYISSNIFSNHRALKSLGQCIYQVEGVRKQSPGSC